jgi:hypothetical protein
MDYCNGMPYANAVVLEIKNVERQFTGFLTGRASKCVISQREWPLMVISLLSRTGCAFSCNSRRGYHCKHQRITLRYCGQTLRYQLNRYR